MNALSITTLNRIKLSITIKKALPCITVLTNKIYVMRLSATRQNVTRTSVIRPIVMAAAHQSANLLTSALMMSLSAKVH
jgi:hypothetical protein